MSRAKNKFITLYILLITALCSGHAFQTVFYRVWWLLLPVAAITVLRFALGMRNHIKLDQAQIAVILFMIMIGATLLQGFGQSAMSYVCLVCYVLVGYRLSCMYSVKEIAHCYVSCMTIITIVSIVGYFLVQTTSVLDSLPSMTNANSVEYRVAWIFNYMPELSNRNCGMFWEPGLFATHLIFSMVFEILLQEKPGLMRLIIFSVGVLTTYSAAGFVLWFLCAMLFVCTKIDYRKSRFTYILSLLLFCIAIGAIINYETILVQTGLANNEFVHKLLVENLMDSSRMRAVGHNLKSFATAPIFGVGFYEASRNMAHVADTSTSTYLMSVFGFMGIFYTIYWIKGILKLPRMNRLSKVLLIAIAIIIINKEPHINLLFSWCLLFSLIRGVSVDINDES